VGKKPKQGRKLQKLGGICNLSWFRGTWYLPPLKVTLCGQNVKINETTTKRSSLDGSNGRGTGV
jgi:hypothetical protein